MPKPIDEAFNPNDPNWCKFPSDKTKALGIYPNELWYNTKTGAGALSGMKSSKYEQYALGKAGLDYIVAALKEQRIPAGRVALLCWDNRKLTVVADKPVATVAATFTIIPPREGPFGPFWVVRDDITPHDARVLSAEDTPF